MPSVTKQLFLTDFYETSESITAYGNGSVDVRPLESGLFASAYKLTLQRDSTNTPNYKSLVKSGQPLPTNFLSYVMQDRRASPIVTKIRSSSNPGANGWDVVSFFEKRTVPVFQLWSNGPSRSNPLTLSAVASKVLDKAKSNQFNVPVFLAEAGQAATMVYQRATQLALMARALRRGDISFFLRNLRVSKEVATRKFQKSTVRFNKEFGKDAANAASNAWLEWSYGWSPLMGDVRNAVNTLMDVNESPDARVLRVSAMVRDEENFTDPAYTLEVSPWVGAFSDQSIRWSRSLVWYYEVKPENLPGRFGLTNPLEVAWELVPFSFVADWFLPIGDYLSSLDAPTRFLHRGGSEGERCEITHSLSGIYTTEPGLTVSCEGQDNRYVYVRRDAVSSTPLPSLSELTLQGTLKQSLSRATSAVALLRQQMVRMGTRR